ncbi:MAG TPA: ABC transporter substrate-binding protein, partial [Acetobacteraceae bacterium]
RMSILRRTILACAAALLPGMASAADVRIMWYSDGNEGEVVRDLLDRFEKQNPDIRVILDRVPYKTIVENLPTMVASGQAPDMARITDLGGQAEYLLDVGPLVKDRSYWETNFSDTLPWMRPAGNANGIFGMLTQLTITLPIINETLFQQAGIPLPGPDATWQDWGRAAKEVAAKTGAAIPVAIDRSGHRISGGAISMGAKFFDGDTPVLVDAGFRAWTKLLYDWHRDGTMSKQIWGSVGGSAYRGANEEFANAQVVMYVSGTWQFPQFVKTIGDSFDWHAAPNPCGPAACTGLPGGAALVGYKSTKNPKEVARLLDYLASEPVYAEFIARTLFLPAHQGLAKKGIAYKADLPQVQKSLEVSLAQIGKLSPVAYRLQGYPRNRVLFNAAIVRLNQAIAGEMSLDDAWTRMTSDVAEGLKAQGTK